MVAAAEQGELTLVEIARVFSVGLTFVKKMLRWHHAGEGLTPRHGGGPIPFVARGRARVLAGSGSEATGRDVGGRAGAAGGARDTGECADD